MAKSRETREAAKVIVNPLFAWSNALLKGGEMMLDSMAAAAKSAQPIRVAVLRDGGAPARPRRNANGKTKAKRARRRR